MFTAYYTVKELRERGIEVVPDLAFGYSAIQGLRRCAPLPSIRAMSTEERKVYDKVYRERKKR